MTPPHPYLDHPLPIVMAHRGFSPTGLENSMTAFAAAVELGIGYLETDVHATADGVLLAFHDRRLDRVTDRTGTIADLAWNEVRRARIGGVEPIPRLEDVLGTWPRVRVNFDIKTAGAIGAFVDVVRRTAAQDRVCVASFSDRRRRAALRGLREGPAPAWSLGVCGTARVLAVTRLSRMPGSAALTRRALAGACCLQLPPRLGRLRVISPALLRLVHAAGAQVHAWTIDDPERMRALLDAGVDGLITNRADLARQVLLERGLWQT